MELIPLTPSSYSSLIVESLTGILDLTIATSVIPKIWKVAHVVPLHKGGDPSDFENYCTISK